MLKRITFYSLNQSQAEFYVGGLSKENIFWFSKQHCHSSTNFLWSFLLTVSIKSDIITPKYNLVMAILVYVCRERYSCNSVLIKCLAFGWPWKGLNSQHPTHCPKCSRCQQLFVEGDNYVLMNVQNSSAFTELRLVSTSNLLPSSFTHGNGMEWCLLAKAQCERLFNFGQPIIS